MSQLAIELEKLEEQIKSLPKVMSKSRVKVAQKAAIAYELLNDSVRMAGLHKPYYETIKKYGRQRALIIEESTSRLDPYNINPASEWIGNGDSFSFPTVSQFVFYAFDENGVPITFNPATMYFIVDDQGVIAGRYAISLFLRAQGDQTLLDYTIGQVTVGGVTHDVLELTTPLAEAPLIGDQYALMSAGDNIGYIEVGIEGLYQDSTWDPFASIDLDNESQVESWYSDMMLLSNTDFSNIAGDAVNGGIPTDDVLLSADSNIRSTSQPPYNDIEASPFFPALNATESDWPSDFETIDTINRRLVINGVVQWVVRPSWRWENRLVPTNINDDPNTESLPGAFVTRTHMNALDSFVINQNDFPVNVYPGGGGDNVIYAWEELSDKVVIFSDVGGTGDPSCTYNSVTDFIDYYKSNLEPIINVIQSDWGSFTNTVNSTHATQDTAFFGKLNQIESLFSNLEVYHDSIFSPVDDGDTSLFDDGNTLPVYDQTSLNAFISYINTNISMFNDRAVEVMSAIGDATNKTGYVGAVIDSVNILVNRGYGVSYDLNRAISSLDSVKELAVTLRKKYDGLGGGL